MAINSKNYVDISTTFPKAGSTARAFGGLVFTSGEALPQAEDSVYVADVTDYEAGKDISLSLDGVIAVFGETSQEYAFAKGYYNYTSPTGRFPSRLRFKKIDESLKDKTGEVSLLKNFMALDKETNQFGSFTFLAPADSSTSTAVESDYLKQLKAVAEYNDKLDTKYLFVVNQVARGAVGDEATAVTNCAEFADFTGVCYVYGATAVSAYMPMAILASTDYQNGQVVNFMFKQFDGEIPTVLDNEIYTMFNQGLVNFCGRTQSNGQTLDFFQRGFNTNGTDTAQYCNEMWFKAECETALLNSLVESERIPADQTGIASVKITVAEICSLATRNGTFMPKEADRSDRKTVRQIVNLSGGEEEDVDGIIVDVGTRGYSIYAYLSEKADEERLGKTTEKIIVYYVFYGTADSVRFIKGNDILLK